MEKIKHSMALFRFLILLGGVLTSIIMYVHGTFASSKRVGLLEKITLENKKILCTIAIKEKLEDIEEICLR